MYVLWVLVPRQADTPNSSHSRLLWENYEGVFQFSHAETGKVSVSVMLTSRKIYCFTWYISLAVLFYVTDLLKDTREGEGGGAGEQTSPDFLSCWRSGALPLAHVFLQTWAYTRTQTLKETWEIPLWNCYL